MLPLFNCINPPVEHAGFPNLLSKCTHVGDKDSGSIYVHTPEFLALFLNTVLCILVNVCPTSNAVPA